MQIACAYECSLRHWPAHQLLSPEHSDECFGCVQHPLIRNQQLHSLVHERISILDWSTGPVPIMEVAGRIKKPEDPRGRMPAQVRESQCFWYSAPSSYFHIKLQAF